jgi:hypothetical protein
VLESAASPPSHRRLAGFLFDSETVLHGRRALDASLSDDEKRIYDVWLHSPSVFASDPVETILAFKIAKLLQYPGSKVLKALRGQEGLDPEMVRRVEEFVREDPALCFVQDGDARRISLEE